MYLDPTLSQKQATGVAETDSTDPITSHCTNKIILKPLI